VSAWFVVRAQLVDPAVKDAFDRWYRDEHLPEAVRDFRAKRGWRGWSALDPMVHYAYYEFETLEQAKAVPGSGAIKRLIAEFDRAWGDRVARTRDIVDIVQAA
jgi:hypothetical protein